MSKDKNTASGRAKKQGQMDRTRRKVLNATVEILADQGYRNLTTEKIAQLSGASRSTIYRHWDSVPSIAMDAFLEILGPPLEIPHTGNIRTDLALSYRSLIDALQNSKWGSILPAMLEASIRDPEFASLLYAAFGSRRKMPRDMLALAVERGEIPEETNFEWLLDSITGAIYHRLFFMNKPIDEPGMIEYLINCAIDGANNAYSK